ncbi:jg10597 [Pararge aegeria aegeria]|uniref:Jg10597 protein n=1 Tax=Pararge aegeria aegeria TaxID=348720 RepID=A0A8S4RYP3_9NEOP|nr:jg10597 [Pararge aegeria aegeria]
MSRYITYGIEDHSPDTGAYCIDYVTAQLTVHNVRKARFYQSIQIGRFRERSRFAAVWISAWVVRGVDGGRGSEAAESPCGWLHKSRAGARTRVAPLGRESRLAEARAPPRAIEPGIEPPCLLHSRDCLTPNVYNQSYPKSSDGR